MRRSARRLALCSVAALTTAAHVYAALARAQAPAARAHAATLGASIATGAQSPEASALPSPAPSASAALTADPNPGAYPLPAQVEMQSVPVPGTGVHAGLARTDVAAPFDDVVAVVLDFAHYNQLLPRVDQSRVIQRRRGQVDAYFSATLLNGLGTLWARMRFTVTRAPGHLRIDGAMVDGNLARFEIRLEVTALAAQPGRTRLEAQLLGLPRFPVPDGFLSGVEVRWAARGVGAMRDRAVQSARVAPPAAPSAGPTVTPPVPPSVAPPSTPSASPSALPPPSATAAP